MFVVFVYILMNRDWAGVVSLFPLFKTEACSLISLSKIKLEVFYSGEEKNLRDF